MLCYLQLAWSHTVSGDSIRIVKRLAHCTLCWTENLCIQRTCAHILSGPHFVSFRSSAQFTEDFTQFKRKWNAQGCKRASAKQIGNQSRVCLPTRWKFEWNKHKQCWMLIKLEVEIAMRNTICYVIFSTWSSGSCSRRNQDNKKQLFKIVFRVVMRVTIDCEQYDIKSETVFYEIWPVFFGGIQKIGLFQINDSPQNIENYAGRF